MESASIPEKIARKRRMATTMLPPWRTEWAAVTTTYEVWDLA
jgi:hypothetical protein